MNQELFRKESIDRISSPEELHDYMKVTSPKMWMLLAGIIALLVGFIIYVSVTTIESTTTVNAYSANGQITAELSDDQQSLVRLNMPVRLNETTGYVSDIKQNAKILLDVTFGEDSDLPDGYCEMTFADDGSLPEKLKNKTFTAAVNDGRISIAYEEDTPEKYLTPGRAVVIGGKSGTVSNAGTYAASTVSIRLDDPEETLPDGTYSAEIVTESVTPIKFLLN